MAQANSSGLDSQEVLDAVREISDSFSDWEEVLSDWEISFMEGIQEKCDQFGFRVLCSEKQWDVLEKILIKIRELKANEDLWT